MSSEVILIEQPISDTFNLCKMYGNIKLYAKIFATNITKHRMVATIFIHQKKSHICALRRKSSVQPIIDQSKISRLINVASIFTNKLHSHINF